MSNASSPKYADLSFQAIVEQSIVGIYVLQDERFQYVNETFASFLGLTRDELTGRRLFDFIPDFFVEQSRSLYLRRITGDLTNARYVSPARHSDGRIVQIEVHGSRMTYRGRPAICGVGIDVTERVQREEELRRMSRQLQELTAHINRVREDQRARFARDLHDVLGGLLASIKMDVKRVMRRSEDSGLREITHGLMDLSQQAIDTVREMSEELRPSGLDHLGLEATMRRELARFGARWSLESTFEAPEQAVKLPSARAIGVYRIFQEALTNIARHANAKRIDVRIERSDDEMRMEISDDGCGIGSHEPRVGSLGILGMRERARDLGGALEIGPRPEGGTTLQLALPITG